MNNLRSRDRVQYSPRMLDCGATQRLGTVITLVTTGHNPTVRVRWDGDSADTMTNGCNLERVPGDAEPRPQEDRPVMFCGVALVQRRFADGILRYQGATRSRERDQWFVTAKNAAEEEVERL